MIFEFRPAKRVAETILLGLVGPSGSGKTYSALLLASGLCAPVARIVVIDTEGHHGRALQYAPPGENTFEFDHLKLPAPYKAERYQKVFEAAEKRAGAGGVVIIDSMSAEHESEGGALEEHHQRSEGKDSKNMIAWANIRPHQHALCRALTNSRCHVICCFRAEDKIRIQKVVEDGREKNKPVPIGWQAIGWKRWPYEMQVCVLLSHERKGVPIIDGFDWGKIPINMRGIIPTDRPLTAEVGRRLAAWAAGGVKAPDSSSPRPDTSENSQPREARVSASPAAQRENSPDTSARPSDSASGNGSGGKFVVWLSEAVQKPFAKGGDAITALADAIGLALDQRQLDALLDNNAWYQRAPDELQVEVNMAVQKRTREIDRAAVESGDHFGGLEDPEWQPPADVQPGLPMEDEG